MAQEEKIIIELDFDTSDFTQSAAKLNKEISNLNKEQRALKKSGEEGSIQYQKNAEALRTNKKELNETNKTISNLTTANKANAGSNEQLKAQLSVLTLEYNKLSKQERESGARGKELNAQINQTTSDLKSNEEAVGNNRRSVGDYGKALGGTPFGSFIGGIKAMGAAFLANPIALIVLAIVGAFKALKEAFVSTEKGQNKLSKAMSVISTIFTKLFDILEPLADFIFDSVIKAFEDLASVAESAAGLVSDALAMFGFEDAAKGLDDFVESANQAAKAAAIVSDARAKSDVLERELLVESAKAQATVAEARRKSNDAENVAAEDRKEALLEAARITDELAAKREAAATLRLKALQLENSLTNSNKEALEAEAQAEAELITIQTQRSNIQKGLLTDQKRVNNEIKKEQAARNAAYKKSLQDGINQSKAEIDLFIAQQGTRAKGLDEQVKLAEQIRDKELAILKRELDAKLISQTEYETQALLIKQDYLDLQTEAVIDNGQRELDVILEANQSKIEAGQFLNDELYEQEQQRLDNQLQAQLDFEAQRLEQGVISQTEYNDAINAINAENEQAVTDLANEKKAADDEQALVDLENQREIDLLKGQDEFETRQQDLDRQKEQELRSAEETGADTEKIQKKFELASKQIDKAKFNNRLELAGQTADALANLAGRESAAGKALAIVGATINTYQAAAAALAPPPIGAGPVFGPILAGTAIATGLANVRKIASVPSPKKAAKGGIFGGDYHSNGGTKGYFSDGTQIEVEKDELFMVLNRNSTDMINRMSSLNELGGGVAFGNESGSSFADGGIGVGSISSTIDAETASENQITAAIAAQPAPVVVVQDINEVQGETAQVADRAII